MRFHLSHLFALITAFAVAFAVICTAIQMSRQRHYLHAAAHGDLETIRSCLANGVDVNVRDGWSSSALMYASAGGYDEIVLELLVAGADLNERTRLDRTALMWAAKFGHVASIRLLLNHGADPGLVDSENMTAFDHAKANGHAAVIGLLTADVLTESNEAVHR